jgi:rubredoxin-NAD+ reductase
MDPLVIIGTGLAGYTTAREWRRREPQRPLYLITADDGASYSKPMLSNGLDKGKSADQLVMADAAAMAETLGAHIWTATRVNAIAPESHSLDTGRGVLQYGQLVLALGADPIRLPLEGEAAQAVYSVNDLGDYRRFRAAIAGARRVTILGACLIGCEFANDLRRAGIAADVVDPAPRPLARLLPEQAGRAMEQGLADAGVRFHLNTAATRVDRDGTGYHVSLADGAQLPADAVLSAVGLHPRSALAETAGLRVERGIVVNRELRTSDPAVFALGDCAEVQGLVLPFVMPLMNAARALAATLAGVPTPVSYPAMPVVVKTPDAPAVICPPPPGSAGTWHEDAQQQGVHSLFRDPAGQLLGFALTGAAVGEKQALAKQVPAWL